MFTLPKPITVKVTELFNAITHVKDDLQIECAEVSLNGDLSRLPQLSIQHRNLLELEADILAVLKNFENKQKRESNEKPNQPKNSVARTRTFVGRMRVTLAGRVIEEGTIANTFVEALKVFGFERVAKLNKKVCGIALFAKVPTASYQKQQHIGDWYITTHVNQQSARVTLEEIGSELNMPIRIDIEER